MQLNSYGRMAGRSQGQFYTKTLKASIKGKILYIVEFKQTDTPSSSECAHIYFYLIIQLQER